MSIALLFLAAAPAANDAFSLQSLQKMGSCIVEVSPWSARQVLAMDYRTPEYADKLKGIGSGVAGRCMRYSSKFTSSGVLFAGSLAEALLKDQVKRKDLPQRIAYDPTRPAIEARSPGEEMALCAALHAPEATADLLQTEPASAEESQAVSLLAPVLGECLQKDTKVEMNRPAIRAMLALAAWRIATAPKGGAR